VIRGGPGRGACAHRPPGARGLGYDAPVDATDDPALRKLLDDYHRLYAGRDDALTACFSEDFSGFTGGGDFLVKDRAEWVAITRQDFAQVTEPIRLELFDSKNQALSADVAVATSFFKIHLPIQDHFLSRRMARLVLVFRREPGGWRICHSGISLPEPSVRAGEVYPMQELVERTAALEALVAERTAQLSEANVGLRRALAEVQALRAESLAAAAERAGLTARETEVLCWVREGQDDHEIAAALGISPRTVQKHVERVLAKMGAKTRLAAVRRTFD
jgi:DNA-binding CsgD family transcriptional regulator/ketosteroid isomerase-like protein